MEWVIRLPYEMGNNFYMKHGKKKEQVLSLKRVFNIKMILTKEKQESPQLPLD